MVVVVEQFAPAMVGQPIKVFNQGSAPTPHITGIDEKSKFITVIVTSIDEITLQGLSAELGKEKL
jgi:hypothetical protein